MAELRAKSLRNRFVDSLVAAISALYLAMITFVAVYSYVGVGVYQHQKKSENLEAIDKLLALRYFTQSGNDASRRAATERDLPSYFDEAMNEVAKETWKKPSDAVPDNKEVDSEDGNAFAHLIEIRDSKFPKTAIPSSYIHMGVPMRMSVGCDVLVTQLSPGSSFDFATFAVVDRTYMVKSEDVTLLNLYRCGLGPIRKLLVLMFRLDDGRFAFAIPESLEDSVPGLRPSPPFNHFPFLKLDEARKRLPPKIEHYSDFGSKYVIIHSRAIDYYMLNYANAELGKHFSADKLDDAAQELYEERQRDSSYLGITAPGLFIVRVGPFLFFVLSFELWRRVRRVPSGKLDSQRYWFAFETSDGVGRAYSHFMAVLPFLMGAWIFLLFAYSQNLGVVLFGRFVTLPGLAAWTFPYARGVGWMTDYLADMALFLVMFQFIVLFLIGQKLIQVVRANAQKRTN